MDLEKYASLISDIDSYYLMSLAKRIHGPYNNSNGRPFVIIINDDGSRRTVQLARHIMEEHLKRDLDPELETVDHIDRDYNNNDISNLRLVPRDVHSADDTRRVKLEKFICDTCGATFERSPRLVRDKSKKGATGIFCGRSCSGIYNRKRQLNQIDKLPVQPYIESTYYRKNKEAIINYFEQKYCS